MPLNAAGTGQIVNDNTRINMQGAFYSFRYSGVHFTFINTNDTLNNGMMSPRQLEWINRDLASAKEDGFISVVIMHKGLVTPSSHIRDPEIEAIRNELIEIFGRNQVALVIQGHDHMYSESFYLDANGNRAGTNDVHEFKLNPQVGVLYVTLATIGEKFYHYEAGANSARIAFGESIHFTDSTGRNKLQNPIFGRLYFDGEDLFYRAYEFDHNSGRITPVHNITRGLPVWAIVVISICSVVFATLNTLLIIYMINKNKGKKLAAETCGEADLSCEASQVEEIVVEEQTEQKNRLRVT
jgi:hypothetical protein